MQYIPLTSDYCQQQTVTLNGAAYDLTVKWNDLREVWTLDIADNATGEPLVYGAALVLGCNILAGFPVALGSMFCVDASAANLDAGPEDLDTRVALFYAAPGEGTIFDA